ncbi:hypothetical protein V8C42DRAFT_348484 [Trichoderma barbatum]
MPNLENTIRASRILTVFYVFSIFVALVALAHAIASWMTYTETHGTPALPSSYGAQKMLSVPIKATIKPRSGVPPSIRPRLISLGSVFGLVFLFFVWLFRRRIWHYVINRARRCWIWLITLEFTWTFNTPDSGPQQPPPNQSPVIYGLKEVSIKNRGRAGRRQSLTTRIGTPVVGEAEQPDEELQSQPSNQGSPESSVIEPHGEWRNQHQDEENHPQQDEGDQVGKRLSTATTIRIPETTSGRATNDSPTLPESPTENRSLEYEVE